MTRRELIYQAIRDNWFKDFRSVVVNVCGDMPYKRFESANAFLEEFSKLSNKEQVNYIRQMSEYGDEFTSLCWPYQYQLAYVTEDNLDRDIKYLVTVVFRWHNTTEGAKDYFTEERFISNSCIDSVKNKTVEKIINVIWSRCVGHYKDEPPQLYGEYYRFRYDSWCWCYVAVKSESLYIEEE